MLYRDTQIDRATVSQEIRQIVLPDLKAPEGSYREVQLVLPLDEPQVYATTAPDAAARYGPNRTYKLPPLAPGAQISFKLLPGQSLWAAAKSGTAEVAVITEYHR